MHLQLLIGSVLFSRSFSALLTPTRSTSDATITPGPRIELLRKQNGDQYMGWLSASGEWIEQSCLSGNTFYQSGEYWACCATTNAGCHDLMPHACVSGTLIYSLTGATDSESLYTQPCTLAYPDLEDQSFTVCNTGFLFQNENDNDPRTNVNCGVSALNWSYYRNPPVTATATPESTTDTSRTTTASPARTSIPPPDPEPKEEKSKAWIAGAVVGPIVGLGLIGFLLWFCLRRKKKTNVPAPHAAGVPPTATAYQQQSVSNNQPPQYYQQPPPMQQDQAAPGMVPFGVAKHDNWAPPQSPVPISPVQQPAAPQWPQQGGTQMGGSGVLTPSPSISPQPQFAQPAPYVDNSAARPFSSELEGSGIQHK